MSEITLLADKLKAEGERLVSYFEALTDNAWMVEIYTEDAVWTVRQVFAHLMTSERALVRLFESIRQGGMGVSDDFVIDRYNARQQDKTKEFTPPELIKQYKTIREEMVNWVSKLDDLDLEKIGRHPFLGRTSLREMIKMVYLHNQIHYRDIKKIINH